MKICLINNLYKPYQRGGAERIVELTASALTDKGHEVFIISTKPRLSPEKPQDDSVKVYRMTSLYYDLDRIPVLLRIFWHMADLIDFFSYFKIRKIFSAEKPDVVITHNLKGLGSLSPWLINKIGIKHVHVLHDIQLLHPGGLMCLGKEKKIDSFFAKAYQAINRKLFFYTTAVISPSKWLMSEHEKRNFFSISKRIILPNPVEIAENKKDPQKKSSNFIFLYVGHLSEAKGVPILLEAYAKLLASAKEGKFRLVLVGKNMLSEKYFPILSLGGVESIGFVEPDRLKNYYETSDCLIMPSLCYENSPTVIYEAASVGLPVISSAIGGASELTEYLNGMLFKAGDVNDLYAKMDEAIKNPSKLESVSQKESKNIKKYQSGFYIEKLLQVING
jgi:glycosyltransferase involved in cell wall biosynthesis